MFDRKSLVPSVVALVLPLTCNGWAGSARSQSQPAVRVDQPGVERRSIAVATYDGGEVTVGEIEDAIAQSSPLAQLDLMKPEGLRSILARSIQFELSAIEAERRGYGSRPAVVLAVKQNAVVDMLAREVDARLDPEGRIQHTQGLASPERAAAVEALVASRRATDVTNYHPELLGSIRFDDELPAGATRAEAGR